MKKITRLIATTSLAITSAITSHTASANLIVDYNIAPQNLINYAIGPSGGAYGTVQGTFSADFTDHVLTAINMSINIFGDANYVFSTPIAFGSFTDPLFPGLTYYEANLSTSSIGALAGSVFYMDFVQDKPNQLFWGNTTEVGSGVFTSFGSGSMILTPGWTVPEPNKLLMTAMAFLLANSFRKYTRQAS